MLLSIHDDAAQASEFLMHDLEVEVTAQAKATQFFPAGFEGVIAGMAAAKVATLPQRAPRITLLASVKAGLAKNEIRPLEFTSAANFSYNRHTDALLKLAIAKDVLGLEAYVVNGTNTYARAVRTYRDLLVEHVRKMMAFEAKMLASLKAKPKVAKITANKTTTSKKKAA